MEASISYQLSSDFVCLCLGNEMISFVLFTWVIQNIKFSVILSILVAWKNNIKVVLRRQISLFTLLHVHPVHRQTNNWWPGKHFTVERMSQNSVDLLVRSCYQVNLVINIPYKTENNINLHVFTCCLHGCPPHVFEIQYEFCLVHQFSFGKCSELLGTFRQNSEEMGYKYVGDRGRGRPRSHHRFWK